MADCSGKTWARGCFQLSSKRNKKPRNLANRRGTQAVIRPGQVQYASLLRRARTNYHDLADTPDGDSTEVPDVGSTDVRTFNGFYFKHHVHWHPKLAHVRNLHSQSNWFGFGAFLKRWSSRGEVNTKKGDINFMAFGTAATDDETAGSGYVWRRWGSQRECSTRNKEFGKHTWTRRGGSLKERSTTKKEHSLASAELGSWSSRAANRRGSTLPLPFCAGLSPVEAAKKSEIFNFVQTAIVKLFQQKTLQENELGALQDNVRSLADREAGSLIYDYYKDQLLKKGMVILREKIKNEQGAELMEMLGDTWNYFFTEILPTLQAIMCPLAEEGFDIRNTTLLEFRNIVVLKVSLREALDAKKYPVPPNIRQMLLILQGLRDDVFLSENQFKCEKLVARVIVPYLGQRGLYEGSPEPVTRANFRPPLPTHVSKVPKLVVTEENITESPDLLRSLKLEHMPLASPMGLRKMHEPSSSHGMARLKPVLEHVYDVGRRHSLIS